MNNPFDDRLTGGVELLSFHASKGREWHTVFVTGVESSLVPHQVGHHRRRQSGGRSAAVRRTTRAI